MIGVNTGDLLKSLLTPKVKVGSEWVHKGQNLGQVRINIGQYVDDHAFFVSLLSQTQMWPIGSPYSGYFAVEKDLDSRHPREPKL